MGVDQRNDDEYKNRRIKVTIKAWVKYDEQKDNKGRFEISPLQKGMGITIGNSLRRVLFSSITGTGIVGMKFEGVSHEFSTISNVVEDVLEIICNLKGVVFKKQSDDIATLTLNVSSKKKVTAGDIKCTSDVEIVNKSHFLFEVTGKAAVSIELKVASGVGYKNVKAHQKESEDQEIDYIHTDTFFSPIIKVNHKVESVRVGNELDHDKLVLDVQTNGTITPEKAVKESVDILSKHFNLFNSINEKPEEDASQEKEMEDMRMQNILNMTIDELELSARSSNCLKRAYIKTVAELLEKDMSELNNIKNFGSKSAVEINERLSQYGLTLKDTAKKELEAVE